MSAFAMIGGTGAKYLLLLRSCHVNKAPINVADASENNIRQDCSA